MIRLFIGLRPDKNIRRLLSSLGTSIPGSRPVPEEQVHLTLRFIGEVNGNLFHDIKESLSKLQSSPITLAIRGTGHFPPRGNPRVIWAGVEPAGDIIILRNKVNYLLNLCGVAPEQRKFHPHFTLARLKNSPIKRVAGFLAANALLQSPPCTINRVSLFSSNLTPKGALHKEEASYRLNSDE